MAGKRNTLFSSMGARVTATFSVALVLFILGIMAIMGVVSHHVTDEIKENMGFDVLLTDDADEARLKELSDYVRNTPYALEVTPHSPQEAADDWQKETGENVVELLGVNPFSPELEVRVKPKWANTDSLRAIASELEKMEFVEQVSLQADMIDNVNSNITTITIALGVIALALLFISFVLINNTVRLTVYARRFIIHTMKLVGARPSFIRRPFIVNNILQGIVAAVVAALLVWALWSYISSFDPLLPTLVTAGEMALIGVGILVIGIIICGVAAFTAANKYISLSYDEMFS